MKFDIKKLIGIIIVVTFIWGINIAYYNSKRIDKPIFFRHVIETGINYNIELNYVENKDNKEHIKYVKIPELSSEPIYITHRVGTDGKTLYSDKHYNYCLLNIPLGNNFLKYDEETGKHIPLIKGDKIITKITYGTVNGEEYTEDIGKVYIKDYIETRETPFVSRIEGSSSISGERFTNLLEGYEADRGVKFTGYGGYFKKEIEDIYNIRIDGIRPKDMKLPVEVSEYFTVELIPKENLDEKGYLANFYDINLDLYFQSSTGDKMVVPFNVSGRGRINNYGDVQKKEVEELIKFRGEQSEGKSK